jgi:glycine/D-amino acid oxidase-like deaminating enzyme
MDFVCGYFGETKDGLPYIGKHPNFPSAYFVLGFGNGITFSIGMERF